MERIPHSHRPSFIRDCVAAWQAASTGVTPRTNTERQKYWRHWTAYARTTGTDPYLNPTTVPPLERDLVTAAFAARVRTGRYGRGNQIRVGGVTDALAAISKTIELVGQPSPLYRSDQTYQLLLERQVEGYRRSDPPSVPQLAVPVTVPKHIYAEGLASKDAKKAHIGALVMIAFYYLLRVGEYTTPKFSMVNGKKVPATRTKQFTVGNIGFFKNGRIVKRSSPLKQLLACDIATMKITNQKNGKMGQTISQHATGSTMCPVRALVHLTHHIKSNGGDDDTLLCSYFKNDRWHTVDSHQIVSRVKEATKDLNLKDQGIDPDLVAAHSLRAGGAMALKLHGYNDTTIMKMGRWTSLTFLQYIHNQIAHLAHDISKKMSIELPFVNIAAIE